MKSAQLLDYKDNFQLKINDVQIPVTMDDELLVKVKYASVNPLDNLIGNGDIKLIKNYKKPITLGNEISGEVVSIGNKVKKFKEGDLIYSRLPIDTLGGFSEYVAVKESAVSKIPSRLDLKEAATIPLAMLTSIQGLVDILKVKKNEKLFINGGSGSLGQVLVPIAKSMGLRVIVSGSERGREKALSMGVDEYLDYKSMPYEKFIDSVDYVIDTIGPDHIERELSIIKDGGKLLSLKGIPTSKFAKNMNLGLFKQLLFGLASKKIMKLAKQKNIDYDFLFVKEDGKQLDQFSDVINSIDWKIDVDPKSFNLNEINEALEYIKHPHNGKVLIKF